ncbi:unnamed protein product [Nezara viridula]|uniref:Uncharacterized protein n=1 Tax=Nezara viridula TaxID=85310 RepID=A0A9P0MRB0_NEZVI|nr:unnamed protein product [Nezara viridula]
MRSQIVRAQSISSVEICTYSRSKTNDNRTRKSPKMSGKIVKQVKQTTSAKFLLPSRAIHTIKQYFLRSTVKDKKYAEDIPCLPFREGELRKETTSIDYVKPQRKTTKINKKHKLALKTAAGNVTQSNMFRLKQV